MPNKLTDAEVKKALEQKIEYCREFDENNDAIVKVSLLENALDLINRQETKNLNLQEKNSNLTSDLTSLQNDLTSAKAEVERLKRELNLVIENSLSARLPHCVLRGDRCAILTKDLAGYDKLIAEIKAESAKEFVEKLETVFNEIESNLPENHLVDKTARTFINAFQIIKNELVGDENVD